MKRKIAVIMAADVAEYSRLISEDEEETLQRFEAYSAVFREAINKNGGRIFNTAGDSILAEFASAVAAVRCAVEVQEELRTRNDPYPQSRRLAFRIGMSLGDVVERGGDLVGDGVNIAARLESIAPAGGLCISRSVHEAVVGKVNVRFNDLGQRRVKNIPDPVHAFLAVIEPAPKVTGTQSEAPKPTQNGPQGTTVHHLPSLAATVAAVLALGGAIGGGLFIAQNGIPLAKAPTQQDSAASPPPSAEVSPGPPPPSPSGQPAENGGNNAPMPRKIPKQVNDRTLLQHWKTCIDSEPSATSITGCQAVIDHGGLEEADAAVIFYHYGRALREAKEINAAIEAYSKSLTFELRGETLIHRGIANFDRGAYSDALADFDQALTLDPSSAEAANNRAWTRFKTGDTEKALADANLAIRLETTRAYIWDTRAQILEALGRRDAAIADYRKALELDATLDTSKAGLARLTGG